MLRMKEVVPIAPGKPGAVGRGACPGAACGVLGAGPTAPMAPDPVLLSPSMRCHSEV